MTQRTLATELLTEDEIDDYLLAHNLTGENPVVLRLCNMAQAYLDLMTAEEIKKRRPPIILTNNWQGQ